MSKKMVKDSEPSFINDQYLLADVLVEVERLIRKHGPDACVDFDAGYNSIDERVTFERLETDKEYQKRLKDEARKKENEDKLKLTKEAKERKEYERLKKKFS